jgi:hypothetical protein
MIQKRDLSLLLLNAFPLSGLAAYAYIGSFTRMLADDFCLYSSAERLGLLRSTWFWYTSWGGRYTAFAADWLIFKTMLGPYGLHLVVPGILVLWLGFTAGAFYLYLYKKNQSAFLHALALAGIFLFVVLRLSPDLAQSLFWWSGMRTYTFPLVALTFIMFLSLLVKDRLRVHPAVINAAAFLLFFLSGGLNEIMAVAQTALLVFLLGLFYLNYVPAFSWKLPVLVYSLAGSLVFVIVAILSPGNVLRQAQLPPPPDIVSLAWISLVAYGRFIAGFFTEPAGITGLFSAVLIALWIGGRYKDLLSGNRRLIPASLFGGLLVSFVCFPPGVYGFAEPPPARTLILPVYFLMAGLLCASFLAGSWLADETGPSWLRSSALLVPPLVLIGFSALTTIGSLYNQRQVYIDFAEKWDGVDAQILQAKVEDQDSVQIPAMDNWAQLERPTANQGYWPTFCYTRYYGIPVYGPPYSE